MRDCRFNFCWAWDCLTKMNMHRLTITTALCVLVVFISADILDAGRPKTKISSNLCRHVFAQEVGVRGRREGSERGGRSRRLFVQARVAESCPRSSVRYREFNHEQSAWRRTSYSLRDPGRWPGDRQRVDPQAAKLKWRPRPARDDTRYRRRPCAYNTRTDVTFPPSQPSPPWLRRCGQRRAPCVRLLREAAPRLQRRKRASGNRRAVERLQEAGRQ